MTSTAAPIVYIIDDDASVRTSLSRLIHSAGMEALTFVSAEEFLNFNLTDRPACLVADVMMKGLTGIELHQKMINRGDTMPVIFITGYDTTETRREAKRTGAIGYFCKPVDDQALLDSIRWAMSKK